MAGNEEMLPADETGTLISADKVEGTKVMNTAGEKLGSIEDVMIDKRSGKVAYAVMSFGGFLGIGDRHHPLPWSMLKYDTNLDGYVVNLDKRVLEGAPAYWTGERVDLADEAYGRKVHDYYHLPPYWL
jgi:sporulation protein YlmC with PRC-barrel domain